MSIFYDLELFLKKLLPRGFILATHKIRAVLAAFYYGFPGKKITVIGVAGTKGKTTATNLITRVLEEAGFKAAMFSTANMRMAGEESLNTVKLTTPSPFFLQKFLAEAVRKKCDFAVIEVSSHALDQHRVYGIDFKMAVITNLMPDHLDYHKNTEEYRDIHLKMLGKKTEVVVINGEDEEVKSLKLKVQNYSLKLKNKFKIISFGLEANNDLRGYESRITEKGVSFKADFRSKKLGDFLLKIPGKFNIYNALAAIGAGMCLGVEADKIRSALEKVSGVPGRLENIRVDARQDFQVIVDYAHSPDSLKTVYEAVKPFVKGRLIAVLGGTGDRDKNYRRKCGALADSFANIVIVANEDPYSEDPEDIITQVIGGVKNKELNKTLFRILDRKEAIKKAVDLAQKNDIIIITGKGSEQFMVWGDKMIPWDDREVAREALRERFN